MAKKQENMTHTEPKKNQSTENSPELTQMLVLAEEDIKTVFITVIYMFKNLGRGGMKGLEMLSNYGWE